MIKFSVIANNDNTRIRQIKKCEKSHHHRDQAVKIGIITER